MLREIDFVFKVCGRFLSAPIKASVSSAA